MKANHNIAAETNQFPHFDLTTLKHYFSCFHLSEKQGI